MKKLTLIIFIASLLLLSGCGTKEHILTEAEEKAQFKKSAFSDTEINSSGDIDFTTEYPVYGKDIDRITCFLKSNTTEEYMYGEEYAMEKLIGGVWYQIPFPENAGWNAIGYILAPQSSNTVYINLTFSDYTFTDGSYRIVKKIGDYHYAAAFELGESDITASTPYGFQKLDKLKKNYAEEEAIRDGVVVVAHNGTENSGKVNEFIQNVSGNIDSMLRIMQFTDEGDPIITDIVYKVDRDNYFIVREDNSRDTYAGSNKGITETIYSYIVTDGNRVYLSNYVSWVDSTENVPLIFTAEDDLWKDIVPVVEELTAERLLANSTIYKVFQPDAAKSLILTEEPLEFGYNSNDSLSEIRPLENKPGIARKIIEALWADDHTILLVCETDSELKYYEFFDITSRSVSSYTTSASDYYIEDGKVIIPE